jgi:hypothetical protein
MGEGAKVEEDDVDDGEDAAAPPAAALPPPMPPTTALEDINDEGPVEMIPEQEALVPHEVILVDANMPEMPQLRLYHALMRDYEENPLRMEDYFNDLDDDPNEGRSDMDESFLEDGSNDRD